ncbi:MAG: alpha-1,2-fucosyltransferase [Bacteroidales bacterium]|jgi:hypothetical protein|nr:alpha-1,2-fucosyltransferase [Bacteroidales bacterium]
MAKVFVKISNGLGNAMFQYALGRKISLQHKMQLKLDFSEYSFGENINHQGIENNLVYFDIKGEKSSFDEIQPFLSQNIKPKFYLKCFISYSGLLSDDICVYIQNTTYPETNYSKCYSDSINKRGLINIVNIWHGTYELEIRNSHTLLFKSQILIDKNKMIRVGINESKMGFSERINTKDRLELKISNLLYKIRKKIYPKLKKVFWNKYPILTDGAFDVRQNSRIFRKDIFLDGYWMNYRIFDDIKTVLKVDLEISDALKNNKYLEILNEIRKSKNSVGIHIRRGYMKYKVSAPVFGVMPISYYMNGINAIAKQYPDISIFVFADDIKWAKENLKTKYPISFIEHYPELIDAHDFELLKKCKHKIIANSTFSWWAAYLSEPEGIIIAPKRWFKNDEFQTHYETSGNMKITNWLYI